jgi:hypothetical protein
VCRTSAKSLNFFNVLTILDAPTTTKSKNEKATEDSMEVDEVK